MPMYEYQCNSCGHKVEILQKISDATLTTCPNCQISNISRVISPTGFQLKGSGWYVTDYTNKKTKAASDVTAAHEPTKNNTTNTTASTTPPTTPGATTNDTKNT